MSGVTVLGGLEKREPGCAISKRCRRFFCVGALWGSYLGMKLGCLYIWGEAEFLK